MFRTELARKKVDSLALLDEKGGEDFFERLPQQILKAVSDKAALFFGYEPRVFSSLNLMTDYSYADCVHPLWKGYFQADPIVPKQRKPDY